MRRLILSYYVSIDGKSVNDNGLRDVMNAMDDPHQERDYVDELWSAGAFLMGRASYQAMAGFWPTSDHPSAAAMNAIPKVVFSHTLTRADEWGETRIASGELADEIAALKAEEGKDLFAVAGDGFQRALVASGLVDEYRLWILPAVTGTGAALVPELPEPRRLRLVSTTAYSGGVVQLRYVPAGA